MIPRADVTGSEPGAPETVGVPTAKSAQPRGWCEVRRARRSRRCGWGGDVEEVAVIAGIIRAEDRLRSGAEVLLGSLGPKSAAEPQSEYNESGSRGPPQRGSRVGRARGVDHACPFGVLGRAPSAPHAGGHWPRKPVGGARHRLPRSTVGGEEQRKRRRLMHETTAAPCSRVTVLSSAETRWRESCSLRTFWTCATRMP